MASHETTGSDTSGPRTSIVIPTHSEPGAHAAELLQELRDRNDVRPWPTVRHSRMYSRRYDWPDRFNRVPWGTTANLVVRASAFRESGGFRVMFPAPVAEEDVDFGVRPAAGLVVHGTAVTALEE